MNALTIMIIIKHELIYGRYGFKVLYRDKVEDAQSQELDSCK